MKVFLGVAAFIAFIVLCYVIAFAVRSHTISACEERGGQAVTSPWYSEHFMDVKCVEARK